MHGKNVVRPFDRTYPNGSRLQVHEVWYTIQGEGPFFGMPAVFVRLTGCNLQCHFCDTVWDDETDPYLTVSEVVSEIVSAADGKTQLVVLTGGEPARQDLSQLIEQLGEIDYAVQLETAGTYWQECFTEENVTIVVSPKTKHVHAKFHQYCKHWKYVVRRNEVSIYDGLPCRFTQQFDPREVMDKPLLDGIQEFSEVMEKITPLYIKFGEPARPSIDKICDGSITIWLSPCDEGEGKEKETQDNMKLVGELCLKHGYRAQVQLHKILQLP